MAAAKKKEASRLKCFLYGPAESGKTILSLMLFPRSVIIDTERGCEFYRDFIEEQGSLLIQTSDIDEITTHLRALLTKDHDYTSVIIDPVTKVYEAIQEKWSDIFRAQAVRKKNFEMAETEDWGFGYWGKVKRDYKRMMTLVQNLDMNVIMTSHQKDLYSNDSGGAPKKIGITFDTMKGADYFFDFVFRIYKAGDKRWLETVKQRAFPSLIFEPKFELDTKEGAARLRSMWGEEKLDRKAEIIEPATPDQVARIKDLMEAIPISDEILQKWNEKANAETWEEYPRESIAKCIEYLEKKIPANVGGAS